METQIDLGWEEVVQIGSTKTNCIGLLPTPGKLSKIIVGDYSGVVYCFEYVNFDVSCSFKTNTVGSEILTVFLQKAKGNIFYTANNSIYGVNSKGKDTFKHDANVSEKLRGLDYQDTEIYISGDFIMSALTISPSTKKPIDKNYYLSNDKINSMVVGNILGGLAKNPILGCQDKVIKVLNGDDLHYSVPVVSSVSVLTYLQDDYYLYGCSEGSFGIVQLGREKGTNIWTRSGMNKSAVTALKVSNFTKKDTKDLILGRDDGSIEVYPLKGIEEIVSEPMAKHNAGEAITGLDIGPIRDPNVNEIVAATFSGKIVTVWDPRLLDINDPKIKSIKHDKEKALAAEVTKLKDKVAATKSSKKPDESFIKLGSDNVKPANVRMTILPSDAAYLLAIESQAPIELVALQSNVPVDLLDIENTKAIVSMSSNPSIHLATNNLLVTLRPEEPTNRLDVKLRTTEGNQGEIECIIFQKGVSICQSFYLPIKPLSLHEKIGKYNEDAESSGMSQILFKGNFSESDMNTWLSLALPDVPMHLSEEECEMAFKSSFTGSHIICKFRKGNAIIRSDSISALALLKDTIAKEAAQRKLSVDISTSMNDDCTYKMLKMIHPKMQALYNLKQEAELVEAIKELKLQQEQEKGAGEETFELSEDYLKIVTESDKILKEHKMQPRKLEYIYGIIVDLFMDRAKVLGIPDPGSKIAALEHILNNYDYLQLEAFFKSTAK